jgi:hypothetical protein
MTRDTMTRKRKDPVFRWHVLPNHTAQQAQYCDVRHFGRLMVRAKNSRRGVYECLINGEVFNVTRGTMNTAQTLSEVEAMSRIALAAEKEHGHGDK